MTRILHALTIAADALRIPADVADRLILEFVDSADLDDVALAVVDRECLLDLVDRFQAFVHCSLALA